MRAALLLDTESHRQLCLQQWTRDPMDPETREERIHKRYRNGGISLGLHGIEIRVIRVIHFRRIHICNGGGTFDRNHCAPFIKPAFDLPSGTVSTFSRVMTASP